MSSPFTVKYPLSWPVVVRRRYSLPDTDPRTIGPNILRAGVAITRLPVTSVPFCSRVMVTAPLYFGALDPIHVPAQTPVTSTVGGAGGAVAQPALISIGSMVR